MNPIQEIVREQKAGNPIGIYSCCSSNEKVIRAVLQRGKRNDTVVLVESTANQVDQFGGYSGMRPADFYAFVHGIANEEGFDTDKLILGGDHLGPLTFSNEPEGAAMEKAAELVRQYAAAGFTKIHLDTSMRVADDPTDVPLPDETIARRSALLCRVAEDAVVKRKKANPDTESPVYVIGSEVPIPGGAQEAEDSVSVTKPEAAKTTIEVFRRSFAAQGLDDTWRRVVGLVVQLGVEFGDAQVVEYNREAAKNLTDILKDYQNMVFEGHSTDYQTAQHLKEMVEDGVAILKVGPGLTFALREGLLSLEAIERELLTGTGAPLSDLRNVMDHAMLSQPSNWQKHYHGNGVEQRFARIYSYSDRVRYYLNMDTVKLATDRLMDNLSAVQIPQTLLSQYMPIQYDRVRAGTLEFEPKALLFDHIGDCIDLYLHATRQLKQM